MGLPIAGDSSAFKEALAGETQGALFDYETLDAENRIVVQQRTTEIHDLIRKTAENVVQIGAKLVEVQQRLAGRFTGWLESEFSWSERTAYNYMAVFQKFGGQKSIAKIANSALYLLAAPGTPETARHAAIEMAEAGEPVTHKMAQVIVAAAKEAEPKAGELFTPEAENDEPSLEEQVAADEEVRAQEQRIEAEEDRATEEAMRTGEHPFAESPVPESARPSATPKRDKLVAEKAATDTQKLWSQTEIQVGISMMPEDGDPRGRQMIVSIRTNNGAPMIQSKRIQEMPSIWPKPIDEMFTAFAQKLAEQKAEKKTVKSATKKPAAKAAKKGK